MRVCLPLLATLVATALGACADEQDDRPITTEYITAAILRPSCGTASCHSSMTKLAGYVFDTIEGVNDASPGTVWGQVECGDMPLDQPLPDADARLICLWANGTNCDDFGKGSEKCGN